jgi:hypothetical protein
MSQVRDSLGLLAKDLIYRSNYSREAKKLLAMSKKIEQLLGTKADDGQLLDLGREATRLLREDIRTNGTAKRS